MIQVIDDIYVYVDKLGDVRSVAQILENNGYQLRYTLSAFEDLSSSISTTYIIFGLLMVFIFIITISSVIIAFNSYIYSMQKDIGILLHDGYSKNQVYKIYRSIIIKPFTIILFAMSIYILILSASILEDNFIVEYMISFGTISVFVLIVSVILLIILKKTCGKDIIYLLKFSKKVE